jgi:transketolase N-terminal domain/subunit
VAYVDNPRKECAENTLQVAGADELEGKFAALGLNDTKKIDEESIGELLETMRAYKSGIDVSTFKSNAKW